MMNQSKFWQLLEYAKQEGKGDLDEHHRQLVYGLSQLPPEEIREFEAICLELQALAYSHDL
jgi:hypothetical protein